MQIDATQTHSCCATAASKAAVDPQTKATADKAPRPPSPASHIDPGLGIVVTQYLNADGGLAAQYPTQQAIASYEIYGISKTAVA